MQKLSKTGKPIIHKNTGLPIFNKSVDYRIKLIKQQLYNGLTKQEQVWQSIIMSNQSITNHAL